MKGIGKISMGKINEVIRTHSEHSIVFEHLREFHQAITEFDSSFYIQRLVLVSLRPFSLFRRLWFTHTDIPWPSTVHKHQQITG